MKKANCLLVLIVLFSSCKLDRKHEQIESDIHLCPDSLLLKEIATDNLPFDKSYIISDSVADYIGIWQIDPKEKDWDIVNKLMELDSIPLDEYSTCTDPNLQIWRSKATKYFIAADLIKVVFRDPYVLDGHVDNYAVLKELTGKDGLMYISEVYYSSDKSSALVGLSFFCGWKCGGSGIRLYKLNEDRWQLAMNYVITES